MRTKLTKTQAALYLAMSERMIMDLAGAGRIPHRKLGKEYTFDRAELDAWWNDQPGVKHPAKYTVTPPVAKRIQTSPDDTSAPALTLVRGAKGTHRAEGSR